MKNKMFVVPGTFVPHNDTVTLLSYKRLRNLDLDFDVFSMKAKEDESLKKELSKDPNFSKFNIKYSIESEWAVPRNHPLRLPLSFFFQFKYIKDSLKEFEKDTYKYLFTSIVPGVSHLCGKLIKKKHPEVIWYASFSDPFKKSPYKKAENGGRGLIYKFIYSVGGFFLYNDKYEEAAILNADKLIFICEEQRDFTLSQYPNSEELKKKSIIMPLTYIPDWDMYKDLLVENKVNNSPKQAVHLGRLYGLRTIDTFIDALIKLKEEDPKLSEKIVFHQYSEIQKPDIEKINKYKLDDVFKLHPSISYKESVNKMKEADILVLFDTLMPKAKAQPYLPSKIVEYMMLKKPVLGICDNNSPSYRILKENGYQTIGSDTQTIIQDIKDLIKEDQNIEVMSAKSSDDFNMLEL